LTEARVPPRRFPNIGGSLRIAVRAPVAAPREIEGKFMSIGTIILIILVLILLGGLGGIGGSPFYGTGYYGGGGLGLIIVILLILVLLGRI
jgi:hypothetical protein